MFPRSWAASRRQSAAANASGRGRGRSEVNPSEFLKSETWRSCVARDVLAPPPPPGSLRPPSQRLLSGNGHGRTSCFLLYVLPVPRLDFSSSRASTRAPTARVPSFLSFGPRVDPILLLLMPSRRVVGEGLLINTSD